MQAHVGRERRPEDSSEVSGTNVSLCRSDIPSGASPVSLGYHANHRGVVDFHITLHRRAIRFFYVAYAVICIRWGFFIINQGLYLILLLRNRFRQTKQSFTDVAYSSLASALQNGSHADKRPLSSLLMDSLRIDEYFPLRLRMSIRLSRAKLEMQYDIVLHLKSTSLIYV